MRASVVFLISLFVLFLGCIEIPDEIDLKPLKDLISQEPEPEPLPADMQRYYFLKNLSCGTFSGDFLIVTNDVSEGKVYGLLETVAGELQVANDIIDEYSFNQTTRTYVLGDQMKVVAERGAVENTVIWKNGRIYNCTPDCMMKVMNQDESDAYYEMLAGLRTKCHYFGKTEMPVSLDMVNLIDVNYTGRVDATDFRCDNFLISANKTYAMELLNSSENLTSEQYALLWGLAHLDGPITECLDESTGVIAYRDLTLDLTDSYRFEYVTDGYMKVNQKTELKYFSTDVPPAFLELPS